MIENAPFVLHVRSEMNKLFVYGTLRQEGGHLRHGVMKTSNFLGKYKTKPNYDMVNLRSFPGLLKDGDNVIVGEVYEVDDNTLKSCDMIEGHPNFYKRENIDLEGIEGVQAYFLPRDDYGHMPKVESGDWMKR